MTIRLGIIGAGIMGERMLRAALDHASDVVGIGAVWDAAPAALDRAAVPLPVRAASAGDVIHASDCVYVATPPATHLAYAEQALAAGRAVFLEKPLATDVAAAAAFAARHAGARVAVNFPFASSLAVERLGQWIGPAGSIGQRKLDIQVAFRTWPRPWQHAAAPWLDGMAEGGFTREVVSHFLFLTLRLLSGGQRAAGEARLMLHEGSASFPGDGRSERRISARLAAGGCPVALTGGVGTIAADDHNAWTLSGPGGDAVRLRDWSIAERRIDGGWQADPESMPNEKARPLVLRRQLEAVARMTRGEPHRLATVDEALDVQTVVEAILANATHA